MVIRYVVYAAIAIAAVIIIIGGMAWFNSSGNGTTESNPQPLPVDTAAMKKNSEELEKREKEVADSLKKKAQDSIQSAKKKANTNTKKSDKKVDTKKPAEKKDSKNTNKTPKKSDDEKKPGLRV